MVTGNEGIVVTHAMSYLSESWNHAIYHLKWIKQSMLCWNRIQLGAVTNKWKMAYICFFVYTTFIYFNNMHVFTKDNLSNRLEIGKLWMKAERLTQIFFLPQRRFLSSLSLYKWQSFLHTFWCWGFIIPFFFQIMLLVKQCAIVLHRVFMLRCSNLFIQGIH